MKSYNLPIKDVAEYFLSKVDADAGDCISNLKLQKLVYYAQGFVMAITNKKLFDEKIIAWQHGPVVKTLYDMYKDFGANCITPDFNYDLSKISKKSEIVEILDEVYNVYGQFSAWKLRQMTHSEGPWQNYNLNDIIPDESIMEFFKTQIA